MWSLILLLIIFFLFVRWGFKILFQKEVEIKKRARPLTEDPVQKARKRARLSQHERLRSRLNRLKRGSVDQTVDPAPPAHVSPGALEGEDIFFEL